MAKILWEIIGIARNYTKASRNVPLPPLLSAARPSRDISCDPPNKEITVNVLWEIWEIVSSSSPLPWYLLQLAKFIKL